MSGTREKIFCTKTLLFWYAKQCQRVTNAWVKHFGQTKKGVQLKGRKWTLWNVPIKQFVSEKEFQGFVTRFLLEGF